MRPGPYAMLCSVARRILSDGGEVDDIVQEALLAAVVAGRTDFDAAETRKWLVGTVRNKARMALRGNRRRRGREARWQEAPSPAAAEDQMAITELLGALSPALRAVAALVLSGHDRREIAYLLNLSDAALRQRLGALKRRVAQAGLVTPEAMPGLTLDLAYGRLRGALLPKLRHPGGVFASHDPDGHLFVVRRSQNGARRQSVGGTTRMENTR